MTVSLVTFFMLVGVTISGLVVGAKLGMVVGVGLVADEGLGLVVGVRWKRGIGVLFSPCFFNCYAGYIAYRCPFTPCMAQDIRAYREKSDLQKAVRVMLGVCKE